jgi:peptidoglycan/xylan/chitin deacetylase (PgdA/CDA1 family)
MSEHIAYVNCKSLVSVVLIALLTITFLVYANPPTIFSDRPSLPLPTSNNGITYAASENYYYDPHIPQEGQRVVCIVFDDGWETPYTNALPVLDQYEFKATFAIVPSFVENYSGYMNWNQIITLQNQGHDIESHSMNHLHLTAQNTTTLNHQLLQSKQELLNHGINAPIFVYPFGEGAGNSDIEQLVQQHYYVARGIKGGSLDMSQPFNPYALPSYEIRNSTNMETFKNYVNQANNSVVVILFYHQISDGSVYTSATLENFAAQMQYLHDNNFEVQTLKQLFTSPESSVVSSWFILTTNTSIQTIKIQNILHHKVG